MGKYFIKKGRRRRERKKFLLHCLLHSSLLCFFLPLSRHYFLEKKFSRRVKIYIIIYKKIVCISCSWRPWWLHVHEKSFFQKRRVCRANANVYIFLSRLLEKNWSRLDVYTEYWKLDCTDDDDDDTALLPVFPNFITWSNYYVGKIGKKMYASLPKNYVA